MTLEDVKLIDFKREMSEIDIADLTDELLTMEDAKEFGLIFLYLVDEFITIDGSFDNVNVRKIVTNPQIKVKCLENYTIQELCDLDQ